MDIRLALSAAEADAFRAAFYSFLSSIERRRAGDDDLIHMTIAPVGETSQCDIHFACGEDARSFTARLPSLLHEARAAAS